MDFFVVKNLAFGKVCKLWIINRVNVECKISLGLFL